MNSNKQNFGPEFPVGLEWSQGAKNTWKNYGTSAGDTNVYSRLGRAPTSETTLTPVFDGQKVLHSGANWASQKEEYASWAPRGETTSAFGSGPPKGDTNRFFTFRNEMLAKIKANVAKQSVVGTNEWRRTDKGLSNKFSKSWYIDLVKSKHQVIEHYQKDPSTTAIAINLENDSGSFSPEQKTHLANAIMIEVFEYEVPDIPDPFVPKFYTHKYIQELLVFKCFDSKTAHWLTTLNFNNLWDKANIQILVERDFSGLVLCKVSIPEPIIDSKEIFHILKLQNKDICMNRWKLVERIDKNSEIQMNISMDEISVNSLKKSNMQLHYGLGKIEFQILQQNFELSQEDDDFSIDDVINPKELESGSPNKLVAEQSQAIWVTSKSANIPQKVCIDSMESINPFSKINQPILAASSRIGKPTPIPENYTDIEPPRFQEYPAISRHIESIQRPQKDYIEASTILQKDNEKFKILEKNIPGAYSNFYRKNSPKGAYDRDNSPEHLERFKDPQNLFRSESPKITYKFEVSDDLYRPESPTNVYQSESPKNLYQSENTDNLYESTSHLRSSEIYQQSRSPPRHYTDNPANSYSVVYEDLYTEETGYKSPNPYQTPLSPNYSRSRDRLSPTHDRYQSPTYQESSLKYRDQSMSPGQSRGRSSLRSRERSHLRSRERSPLRSRERSPLRSRERSPFRSRERNPRRSRERNPPRYRDQGRSPNRNRERSPLRARDRNRSSPRYRSRDRRSRSPNLGRTRSPPRYRSRDQSPSRSRDDRYRR